MTANENNAFDHTILYSVACPAICPLVSTVNGLIDIHASRIRNNQWNENIPPVGGPIGLLVWVPLCGPGFPGGAGGFSPDLCIYSRAVTKIYNTQAKIDHSKTCLKLPLSKRPRIGSQDQLSLNTCQKYCRMLPLVHSAISNKLITLRVVFLFSLLKRLLMMKIPLKDIQIFFGVN